MKRLVGSIFVIGCVLACGCHGPEAHVKGALVQAGAAVTPKDDEEITMSFIASNTDAEVAIAEVDFEPADGTFKVHGPVREGIPPGEYKIVLCWRTAEDSVPDRFGGAFSEEKTPLRYVVTTKGVQELVIDVKEHTVKEK